MPWDLPNDAHNLVARSDESSSNLVADLGSDERTSDLVRTVLALGRSNQHPNDPTTTTWSLRRDRIILLASCILRYNLASETKPIRLEGLLEVGSHHKEEPFAVDSRKHHRYRRRRHQHF